MPQPTVQAAWTDPFASPMELAIASARELEQEWREQVTDGIEQVLCWFDHVPLTDPAAEALAAARRHLQDAHAQVHALTTTFLAANSNPNHNTEA